MSALVSGQNIIDITEKDNYYVTVPCFHGYCYFPVRILGTNTHWGGGGGRRHSTVSTVTGLQGGQPGFGSGQKFLFVTKSSPVVRHIQLSVRCVPGSLLGDEASGTCS
jgi:hypothetical protein